MSKFVEHGIRVIPGDEHRLARLRTRDRLGPRAPGRALRGRAGLWLQEARRGGQAGHLLRGAGPPRDGLWLHPRRRQGRRHPLSTVLGIAAGATLCGMHGYLAISDWAKGLGQRARQRFGCRYQNKRYIVPSLSIIRDVLIRVNPVHLDRALQRWNQAYGQHDESLAIDGKTMCNAIDDQGYQTHIMSAVGHQSKTCYTQKK